MVTAVGLSAALFLVKHKRAWHAAFTHQLERRHVLKHELSSLLKHELSGLSASGRHAGSDETVPARGSARSRRTASPWARATP